MRIALIDYGAGNLTSVRKALCAIGVEPWSPERPDELDAAEAVIVPGVGNFAATRALGASWRTRVRARIDAGVPFLGICLGLQWIFEGSEEAPDLPGLGLLPGRCGRLREASAVESHTSPPGVTSGVLKVPHVGWNTLEIRRTSWLLDGVPSGTHVYFTHSYAAPVMDACLSTTTHGTAFASSVERERVGGVQFHPEKSGDAGLAVLRNFAALVRDTRTVAP